MTETTPALLSAHIRARLAKSTLDSPAINISRAGWEMILGLLERPPAPDEDARIREALPVAIAQLRHAYAHLHAERVTRQREFADGLISPQIARLEQLAAGDEAHQVPGATR